MQPPEATERDRAVARLGQLAREQRAAIDAGDAERLCLVADLIGPAIQQVRRTLRSPDAVSEQAISDARSACDAAAAYLEAGLARVAGRLRALRRARVTTRGYRSGPRRARAIDDER